MARAWMFAAAMAAAIAGRAELPGPDADAQVTILVYASAVRVPLAVMERAKRVAGAAFVSAGIQLKWEARRPGDPHQPASGETITVVLEGTAPASAGPRAMAVTDLRQAAWADVRIFYNRVAAFHDRTYMPEFLGNVLAHELAHVLQGVARHSTEGLLKAVWNARDYSGMVRGPLAFTSEDVELLRARVRKDSAAVSTADAGL